MLDSYLCPKCKGLVPEILNTALSFCVNCGEKYSLKPFRKINEEAQKYLDSKYQLYFIDFQIWKILKNCFLCKINKNVN